MGIFLAATARILAAGFFAGGLTAFAGGFFFVAAVRARVTVFAGRPADDRGAADVFFGLVVARFFAAVRLFVAFFGAGFLLAAFFRVAFLRTISTSVRRRGPAE
ncbi:MAG TPA: hypothetical protein VNI57_04080 [Candidatus Saccharimonadales bacterium]|nr:hypothetical protein [Candidatus Saccharimonadales bacterium]